MKIDIKEYLADHIHDYIEYISREIKHICTKLPKRSPGSDGERQASEYMARALEETCDSVVVESYKVHPDAFYGWIYFTNTLYLVAIVLLLNQPLISAVLIAAGFLIDILEFVLYKQAVDILFPVKTGYNVTAIKQPKGEIKQRVLFNGHTDAAWEWPINYYFGGIVFEAMALIPTIGAFYYFVLAIISAVCSTDLFGWWMGGLLFVPFIIAMFFIRNKKLVVDGANDNLTGCYIGIALMKAMHDADIDLEHIEVGVILTGSEEAGLRGAKAWAAKHKDDYKDVPTSIMSFDTIHDPSFLGVNYRDLNGTVVSDKALANKFMDAAATAQIPCKKTMVPLVGGATDSAAFSQAGFRSIGITALNHKLEKYYHTRLDSWYNLNSNGLKNCLLICAEMLEKMEHSDK